MAAFKFKEGDRVIATDYNPSIWCEIVPGNTLTVQAYLPDFQIYKVLRDGFKFPVFMKETQLNPL